MKAADLQGGFGGSGKPFLRICLLTYRGNPTCGGQGVYIRHLARALTGLGHQVTVISGPPYPHLPEGVCLQPLPGLDLYNPDHLFQVQHWQDLCSPLNQYEFLSMCTGGFPEPLTFGTRARRLLFSGGDGFDVVHDNQSLAYGLLGIARRYPAVATIHHPITVDRDTELASARGLWQRLRIRRWYSFLPMQKRVARRIPRLITVSRCSRQDIGRAFAIPEARFRVVPNGINTDDFHPLPGVVRRDDQILVTNSADTPLKGLRYLLEAVAYIRQHRPIRLLVIGSPKQGGEVEGLVSRLGLEGCVRFTGRIPNGAFARYYAESTLAVIPSLYEGFGLPAGEAMACGVPVVSTTGGALPEVVQGAGLLVPPADTLALKEAIAALLDQPERRRALAEAGLAKVKNALTWRHAALATVEVYREVIDAHRRV